MDQKKKKKVSIKTADSKRSESSLSDYCLDRLFDPEQLYYTPMEDLIQLYAKRNLRPGRMYNLAKKYGHVPKSRRRIIHAPLMEKPGRSFGDADNVYHPASKINFCSSLNELQELDKTPKKISRTSFKIESETSESENENEEVELNYSEWLKNRKKLRKGLNSFDLNPDYLRRKKDLTEIEKRVLRQMLYVDTAIQTDPIVEKPKVKGPLKIPKIKCPTPQLMEKIETILEQNKWRLIDLFKDIDKNKEWKILKSDLVHQCKKGRLDANESMIEELIGALGSSNVNFIDYKSLASGRQSHLLEKRNQLKEPESRLSDNFIPKEYQIEQEQILSKSKLSSANDKKRNDYKSFSESDGEESRSIRDVRSSLLDNTSLNNSRLSIDSRSRKENKSPTSDFRATSSKLSMNSEYLQLPKIEIRPTFYPNEEDFRNKGVEFESLNKIKKQSALKKKQIFSGIDNTKQKIAEFRYKLYSDTNECVNRTKSLNLIDENKLKRGLMLPQETNLREILDGLKLKAKKEKKWLQLQANEEKLLKKKE